MNFSELPSDVQDMVFDKMDMKTKSNFLKTTKSWYHQTSRLPVPSTHLQQQGADNAKRVLVAQLLILQRISDGPRPSVIEMSRLRKPLLHLLLDMPSQANVHLVASSHGDGIIVGGYRKVSPMIKSYKSFLHMIAGVNVTRAILKSQRRFNAFDEGALTIPEIMNKIVHDNPSHVQFCAHVVPDDIRQKSFLVRTVSNPAYKWVGIYTDTDQCLIVKHKQISPTALNWKALTFATTITFELTSDFDIRGPPAPKGRFKNLPRLGGFTHGFDGFVQRSL